MREKELREVADCALCGKPFGHSGMPLFWRVTVERYGVNAGAIQRQTGLTALLDGHAHLAMVMGADEEMATPFGEPIKVTVCEPCSQDPQMLCRYLDFAKDESGENV